MTRRLYAIFCGLLAFFLLTPLPGQAKADPEEKAILVRGTEAAKGLPFFEPNVIACLKGSYSFQGGEIEVWFTKEPIALDSSWSAERLGDLGVMRKAFPEARVTVYRGSEKWTVFLSLDHEEKRLAAFLEVFLSRFRYFLRYTKDEAEISFPASLKVPR